MAAGQALFDELSFYTLAQPRPPFIHQLAIDAWTAQRAGETTKPIAVTFALVGLCLHLEKNYTGLQVQQVHMRLAGRRKEWPALQPPLDRGAVGVADVLAAAPGEARDAMIHAWCASVWRAWHPHQKVIRELLRVELGIV